MDAAKPDADNVIPSRDRFPVLGLGPEVPGHGAHGRADGQGDVTKVAVVWLFCKSSRAVSVVRRFATFSLASDRKSFGHSHALDFR